MKPLSFGLVWPRLQWDNNPASARRSCLARYWFTDQCRPSWGRAERSTDQATGNRRRRDHERREDTMIPHNPMAKWY
jgi:hypothetical protein